jgi:uncharacterized protein YecE (DUF72 family)
MDGELPQLPELCHAQVQAAGSPVYVMFNDVYMLDDALRFQRLLLYLSADQFALRVYLSVGPTPVEKVGTHTTVKFP